MDSNVAVVHRTGVGTLLRAAAFAAAFAVTYVVLVVLPIGQQADATSFADFGLANQTIGSAAGLYRLIVPILLALVALVYGIIALVRRRVADVARAVLLVLVSVGLCEGLKLLLPRPNVGDFGYSANTFPSGHVAFAMSTALAITMVLPRHANRAIVAVVMLATVGVAWCSVASFAHRPSDVVGAALVVGAVGCLVLWRSSTVYDRMPALAPILLCCAGGSVALVVLATIIPVGAITLFWPGPGSPLGFLGWSALCTVAVVSVAALTPRRDALPSPGSSTDGGR
ncbi:phosphatase PAP2 family protein [Planctomonas sp. JC2975]|uniref:phosphatase PAP2 family protein n=1 Tax=Planctomonas sp. JC2975 TaxID=2729626 RepID=UPI00147368EF|nr:phosphatase PAP2 family protein [Planctomonas sp. JC2975]NNC11896.1 phosphatase PAP2 family protein [Planctomonas sp. JC2975]